MTFVITTVVKFEPLGKGKKDLTSKSTKSTDQKMKRMSIKINHILLSAMALSTSIWSGFIAGSSTEVNKKAR